MSRRTDGNSERFHRREEQRRDQAKQRPGDDEAALPPPVDPIQSSDKVRRNEPCPCGSGKKYKLCCGGTR